MSFNNRESLGLRPPLVDRETPSVKKLYQRIDFVSSFMEKVQALPADTDLAEIHRVFENYR